MRMMVLALLLLLGGGARSADAQAPIGMVPYAPEARSILDGVIVFIDVGHGARNTGTKVCHRLGGRGLCFVEKEYNRDSALRLQSLLKPTGAFAPLTVVDRTDPLPNDQLLASGLRVGRDEAYALNGRPVLSNSAGIMPRWDFVDSVMRSFPARATVLISIHHDSAYNGRASGTHFIVPSGDKNLPLVQYLAEEFRRAGRLRQANGQEYLPVVENGSRELGRHLTLLQNARDAHKASPAYRDRVHPMPNGCMVLVEIDNLGNSKGAARTRQPQERQRSMEVLAHALIGFLSDPGKAALCAPKTTR